MWKKKSLGPGPTELIGGNEEAGFFGEVPSTQFITGDELARRIGLKAGTSQFSNEPWLKFSYLGGIEFIAKKPFRYAISWENINNVDAVFGNRIIEIGGIKYKVRLIKGKTEGKQDDIVKYSEYINYNSEWNKLILPIHVNAPSNWKYPKNVESPTENWNIRYTDANLITMDEYGEGAHTICLEHGGAVDDSFIRGGRDVSSSGAARIGQTFSAFGWRPVLEIVD